MVYSARTLALLLAVSIAIITGLFLSLLDSVSGTELAVAALISFSASYLLFFIVLEFVFFREINKIYKVMDKLRRKELQGIKEDDRTGKFNPLGKINEEIHSFATLKQKEIDELIKLDDMRYWIKEDDWQEWQALSDQARCAASCTARIASRLIPAQAGGRLRRRQRPPS